MTAHTFSTPSTVFSLALGRGGGARARCVAIGGRTQTTFVVDPVYVTRPGLFLECVRVHCGLYHMLHGHEINVKEQSSSERRALLVIPQDFFYVELEEY